MSDKEEYEYNYDKEVQRILNEGCYVCGKQPATHLSAFMDDPRCDDCFKKKT